LRLLPQPERATVLVVGAGEMGALAVRALARRVLRVVVANRDRSRGDALARSAGAEAVALADLPRTVADADAVVSAADTRGAVLTEALLAPRVAHSPLPLVDIAVPRSVGARARALSGLTYRSVDDLPGARLLSAADAEGTRAECAAEAARFSKEIAERAAAHAIRDVRAHADAVRLRQLDRALRRLGHLSPRDRRVIEALSARVMNALLHEPTIALKSAPHRSDEALALFGIGRDRS
jgi:glutamyl-tRNA reductase